MNSRPWILFLLLGLVACGDETVEVRVVLGDCDGNSIPSVTSANVVLKRDDNFQWIGSCTTRGAAPLRSIEDFAGLLSRSFEFRDVPVGGRWTIAVRGFSDNACNLNNAVFCGRTTDLLLPPPGGSTITVNVNCPPIYSDLEDYKTCIRE